MKDTQAYRFDGAMPVTRAIEELRNKKNSNIHHIRMRVVPVDGGDEDE